MHICQFCETKFAALEPLSSQSKEYDYSAKIGYDPQSPLMTQSLARETKEQLLCRVSSKKPQECETETFFNDYFK